MRPWPYPAPEDRGGARHLLPGHAIPILALPSTLGSETSLGQLPELTILFVYPWTGRPGLPNPPHWDDIPGAHGSTPEAETFRDLHPEFVSLGAAVFGLSTQSSAHQSEFADRLGLPFALLSDESRHFQRALALPVFETGGETYLERLTLVVRNGVIARTFYPVHPPDRHAAEVLDWIRKELPLLAIPVPGQSTSLSTSSTE